MGIRESVRTPSERDAPNAAHGREASLGTSSSSSSALCGTNVISSPSRICGTVRAQDTREGGLNDIGYKHNLDIVQRDCDGAALRRR